MILLFLIVRRMPTIRELIVATPLSLSSPSATGLSAHAPAQRAGAQRLRALYRFLDAGDTETFRMRSRPASKKRRGTKSREVGRRRSSGCYEVLDLGRSKSGGVETRGPVKRCGAIFAI